MNRNDLVVAGLRLYGLYLFVNAILGVMDLAPILNRGIDRDGVAGCQVAKVGLMMLIGLILFFGAPRAMDWLHNRDEVAMLAKKSTRRDRPSSGL